MERVKCSSCSPLHTTDFSTLNELIESELKLSLENPGHPSENRRNELSCECKTNNYNPSILIKFTEELSKVRKSYQVKFKKCRELFESVVAFSSHSQGQTIISIPTHPNCHDPAPLSGFLDDIKLVYIQICGLQDSLERNRNGLLMIIGTLTRYHSCWGDKLIYKVESSLPQTDLLNLQQMKKSLIEISSNFSFNGNLELAQSQLDKSLQERLEYHDSSISHLLGPQLQLMSSTGSSDQFSSVDSEERNLTWVVKMILILVLFAIILSIPLMPSRIMNRALGLCFLVISLWVTELVPLFATALLVPVLGIMMEVLQDPVTLIPLTPPQAAAKIIPFLFSQLNLMLIGCFSLASCMSRYGLAKQFVLKVLNFSGLRNDLFILCLMILAICSSAVISNVATPVIFFSILQDLLRSFQNHDMIFSKQIVLAVAFASNIGGMISPISSPQNMFTLDRLFGMGENIGWAVWFLVSLPICTISLISCWLIIIFGLSKTKSLIDTPIARGPPINLGWKEGVIIFTTALTICLWCSGSLGLRLFGNSGIISLIPFIILFGLNILKKEDLNTFPWHIIILTMGGNALTEIVRSSGLLDFLAKSMISAAAPLSFFIQLSIITLFITIITSFVSHTVGAMVFIPILQEFGKSLSIPNPKMFIMMAALSCSAGMMMPISSFPNITAFSQEDGLGRRYLNSREFTKFGSICSLLVWLSIALFGYLILSLKIL